MDPRDSYQYGDGQDSPQHVEAFLEQKFVKYIKLKEKLKKMRPSLRLCELSMPKHCVCVRRTETNNIHRPHIHVIKLDERQRTRLEQLAFPRVRYLLHSRALFRNVYHPKRYSYINKMIKRSLLSQYSLLANVQAPEKRDRRIAWTKKEWKQHRNKLSRLARPKRIFKTAVLKNKKLPLTELKFRIKRLAKPKRIFLPPPEPRLKNLTDMKRTIELAKPKPFDSTLYAKPEPVALDRSKNYKTSQRILKLSEPQAKYKKETDLKENPFQVSANALKYKCKEGSRLANLAKPKEYEEPAVNPAPFVVKKNALKAKPSKRIIQLARSKPIS